MGVKKYHECAHCGCELGDTFLRIMDNFLIAKYFDFLDGSDNAFCSEECVCASLMVEECNNEM